MSPHQPICRKSRVSTVKHHHLPCPVRSTQTLCRQTSPPHPKTPARLPGRLWPCFTVVGSGFASVLGGDDWLWKRHAKTHPGLGYRRGGERVTEKTERGRTYVGACQSGRELWASWLCVEDGWGEKRKTDVKWIGRMRWTNEEAAFWKTPIGAGAAWLTRTFSLPPPPPPPPPPPSHTPCPSSPPSSDSAHSDSVHAASSSACKSDPSSTVSHARLHPR